jgi:hypothetical protein
LSIRLRSAAKTGKASNGLNHSTAKAAKPTRLSLSRSRAALSRALGRWPERLVAISGVPLLVLIAGCGGGVSSNGSSNSTFSISPGTLAIDTNCTGCNGSNVSAGSAFEQFKATLNSGGAATVTWAVSGGDAKTGAGTIDQSSGQYTPPSYLTGNSIQVTVTAALVSSPSTTASATITVTPGFTQPLAPENAALGSSATLSVTGYIAEAGGGSILYALSSTANGSSGGQGSLGATNCTHNVSAYTYCTVIYTAPTSISVNSSTYIVARVGSSSSISVTGAAVLLNSAGISSSPITHQSQQVTPIALGTSGGNNNDYDISGNQIADCCGGTLGSLVQSSNGGGTQYYILSNNHVLARSDQASTGEMIIQPGLIDNNCTPNGVGSGTTPVGVLTTWLPLSSASTNADAAIAAINSEAVNTTGAIQELGLPQGGVLSAAPPGISSSGGKGESASVNMEVAKSGRTTGLTCGSISAVSLDVQVSYYKNCEETEPYLTKSYTNQIGIEGNQFSDAGDSGSLVVDAGNAEPVGLFFAGGVNSQTGISEGVANPVATVLSELGTQQGTSYTFVGAADHPVSCLNYGAGTFTAASAITITAAQSARAERALTQARMLVSPTRGILGTATGKSIDHPGEAAIIVYIDQNSNVSVPQTIDGVRTEVIPTTAQAVAAGTAPQSAFQSNVPQAIASSVLTQAIAAKQQVAQSLMKKNPAFFGVGVGQSLDNPKEAALVIYVDRREIPATLPATINGLRARYIIMDRLHVTRSWQAGPVHSQGHCMVPSATGDPAALDPLQDHKLRGLNLF